MVHLIVQRLVDDGTVVEDNIGILDIPCIQECQGVLHPVHIVTVWIVLVSMSTTRLLSGLGCNHLLTGLIQKVFKLEGLDQIGVPDQAPVLDADILVLLHDLRNLHCSLLQVICIPVDGGQLLHGNLKLPAQSGCGNGAAAVSNLVEASDRPITCILGKRHGWAVGLHELSSGVCGLSSEDHKIEQRVGTKTVGSVDGRAADLTGSEQAWDNGVALTLQDLALPVGRHTSHVVVDGRQDWCRLLGNINTGKDLCGLGDTWQTLGESLRRKVIQVQVDVVLVGTNTTALTNLHGHRSAYNIARSKVLCGGCIASHERLTLAVAKDSTFSSAAFCQQAP